MIEFPRPSGLRGQKRPAVAVPTEAYSGSGFPFVSGANQNQHHATR